MTLEDPTTSDSVSQYAADLRMLRLAAGSPTLSRLQHDTGVSRTVISDAFGGKQLPSSRTVDRIVRSLDGDPLEWVTRRDRLAGVSTRDSVATAEPGERRGKTMRKSIALLIAVAAFVVGSSAGVVATAAIVGNQVVAAEPISPRAQINVRTGIDPAMTPCVNDAKVAASEDRVNNTRLQIIWSNKCYAGWARIARYDGKAEGNSVTVSIYPETAAHGPDRQDATEPGVQGAYTTLMVRPSPQTRLCAVGSITVNGNSIDLGEPICT